MFTCDMSHCDDMAEFRVVVSADEELDVCEDCARDWVASLDAISVERFSGLGG